MQHIFHKNSLIIGISRKQFRKSLYFTWSSNSAVNLQNNAEIQTKLIGKAMKAYLERSKEHDIFMKQQHHEYQIGKRHLANMMGEDPYVFSQTDIDSAIEYLFPSGLYDKKACPMMKLPEEIFPQRKAAEFDESGRPFHFMFYTGKPHFYKLLYDIVENINNLLNYEDSRTRSNLQPDTNLILDLNGYQWLQKEALETFLLETIGDKDYESFINAIERLSNLTYSYRVKEFILTYKKLLLSQNKTSEISKLCYDKVGKAYITTYECCRKRAIGNVTVYYPGLGEIIINGQNLDYFKEIQPREQLDRVEKVTEVALRHCPTPEDVFKILTPAVEVSDLIFAVPRSERVNKFFFASVPYFPYLKYASACVNVLQLPLNIQLKY